MFRKILLIMLVLLVVVTGLSAQGYIETPTHSVQAACHMEEHPATLGVFDRFEQTEAVVDRPKFVPFLDWEVGASIYAPAQGNNPAHWLFDDSPANYRYYVKINETDYFEIYQDPKRPNVAYILAFNKDSGEDPKQPGYRDWPDHPCADFEFDDMSIVQNALPQLYPHVNLFTHPL